MVSAPAGRTAAEKTSNKIILIRRIITGLVSGYKVLFEKIQFDAFHEYVMRNVFKQ